MSIQAVSNVSIFQPLESSRGQRPDFRQLTSAPQTDIGGAELTQQSQTFWQQRKADLNQLGEALRAGDADAAQKAYDALVALGKNGPLQNGETFHRADRAQDFAAIGEALASGDQASALTAFAALAATFRHGVSTVGGLPPGPPTPIPPQGGPPGPPTHIHPPTSVGGGPGVIELNGANTKYPRAANSLRAGSKTTAQNGSLSVQA